ncbi:MAG: hypothetical protein ACJ74U_16230 [Jatrophihabitantaceae bacterium]
MNQALFERIEVEEDGTVIGYLAGPDRQLLNPDLVISAPATAAEGEERQATPEPLEQAWTFDPSAWHHGVPAWLSRQRRWRQRTKKPLPSHDVRGSARTPNRTFSYGWG